MAKKSNPKLKKNGGPGTNAGNFLRKIGKGDFVEKALTMVTQGVSGNWMGAVQTLLSKDPDVTPEQQAQFDREYELDVQNVADARLMQREIATSSESTLLAKNFIYYLASFWSVMTVTYIFVITFYEVENVRVADTILGFLLGTIVATIINFFFGSSLGSKNKTKRMFNNN